MRRERGISKPTVLACLLGILAAALLFLSISCSSSPGSNPLGALVSHTDCKSQGALAPRAEGEVRAAAQECIEYSYDGHGVLRLKHVNAGFNCCPGKISADLQAEGGEIRITEKESTKGCECECLYDTNYEFVGIKPGVWRITVVGPYQPENDPPLEFSIDLAGATSGSFCVDRTAYPWASIGMQY